MNKIILADSQAIFRAGTAKVLAADADLRIVAQCADLERLLHAVTTYPGSVVLFATSLRPDLNQLRQMLDGAGSRGVVIAENCRSCTNLHQARLPRGGLPLGYRQFAHGVRAARFGRRYLGSSAGGSARGP